MREIPKDWVDSIVADYPLPATATNPTICDLGGT